jgi:hypothetical protein
MGLLLDELSVEKSDWKWEFLKVSLLAGLWVVRSVVSLAKK